MKKIYKSLKFISIPALVVALTIGVYVNNNYEAPLQKDSKNTVKRSLIVNDHKYDGPEKFAYYQSAIRVGQEDLNAPLRYPQYYGHFRAQELQKARQKSNKFNSSQSRSAVNATFVERGPANVPGRTRTVIVDPDDATNATWFAGNASGGIWKTTNSGGTWIEIAPDLENMAIVTMAMSEANTSVIYAGTGEGFIGAGTFLLNGDGIYKSEDKGGTWTLLASTNNDDFINVSRIVVDPTNENVLIAGTSGRKNLGGGAVAVGAIMRSTDGGASWTKVHSTTTQVQQIIVAPSDFNIQYAALNGVGVLKSTDAGLTWNDASNGLALNGRIELAVSSTNPNKVYGSALGGLSGTGSDLYLTENAGSNWNLIKVEFSGSQFEFLGGQGWYDNTIMVNPFNDDNVYFGGVSVFSITRNPDLDGTTSTFEVDDSEVEDFISFFNFSASAAGGTLEVGSDAGESTVEVRFGTGISQMAHRFTVPDGRGSGAPATEYTYQDYVEVPFEVWDVTNNTQLMVSFRDQQKDGSFDLIESTTSGDASTHSREYLYISNIAYDPGSADANIAVQGGHEHKSMHFMWPVLSAGATWNASALPESKFVISYETVGSLGGDLKVVADVYGQFDNTNVGVHPDQHFLTSIITNEASQEFKVLLGNDGGMYLSDASANPATIDGSFNVAGMDYNTTQFYGADKVAGEEEYLGGAQDNGTWVSPDNEVASAASNYNFMIGGDGFEVVAHYTDPNKLIGGSQFNGFVGTEDRGATVYGATSGLSGSGPFVSRLSASYQDPDLLFTVEAGGVYRSTDFGKNWKLTPITDNWGFWSGIDVEVSKADPRIVWAGGRMDTNGSVFVSQDGGISFEAVPNFDNIGLCTGIYSDPIDANTAYVVFSVADSPKVLKTTDLGQTWTDISGYSIGSTSTGFPNVATFALQAMPYDNNILWAGTEIGLFESLDAGATWNVVTDLPAVTIWDFKIKDGQVIIATHGRGIWTADIAELTSFVAPEVVLAPKIDKIGTSLTSMQANLTVSLRSNYDNTEVFSNGVVVATIAGNSIATTEDISIDFTAAGEYELQVISSKDGTDYYTEKVNLVINAPVPPISEYLTDFGSTPTGDFELTGWTISKPTGFNNNLLSTSHPYPTDVNLIAKLNSPITIATENAIISFREVVQVEEGEPFNFFGDSEFWDYVIVEGSTDGINWTPLLDGYDSDASNLWDGTSTTASSDLFVSRVIDIHDTYSAGEIVLIRFRLFSDAGATAWGWGIDDLNIQSEQTITGLQSQIESKVSIYPNPASEELNINFDNVLVGSVILQIMDFNGKVLLTKDVNNSTGNLSEKIDLSDLSFGLYTVILSDKSNTITKKVLVY